MYLCKFEENPSTGLKDIMGTRICHLNPPVTLKMRSRSSKPYQLLGLHVKFENYRYSNLIEEDVPSVDGRCSMHARHIGIAIAHYGPLGQVS